MICGQCRFVVTEQELHTCPRCGNASSWSLKMSEACDECGSKSGDVHDIRCSTRCKSGHPSGNGEQCLRGLGHKGEHEFKGLRVQAKVHDGARGFRIVEMVVTDPVKMALIKNGTRPGVSVGYHQGGIPTIDPVPATPAQCSIAVDTTEHAVEDLGKPCGLRRGHLGPHRVNEPSRTAGFDQIYQDTVVGIQPANEFQCPKLLVGKGKDAFAAQCRKRRGHPGDHFAPVGDYGAYYTWDDTKPHPLGLMYTLHPAPVPPEMIEQAKQWRSGGASEIVDATPPEMYEAMERDIRDQLIREGKHLRSVPMPEDRVHPGDCSTDLPYDHRPGQPGCVAPIEDVDTQPNRTRMKQKFATHLKWFQDEAAKALAKDPNITFKAWLDSWQNEPDEGPSSLTCFRCGEPALPRSQMCAQHEREEGEEIEGHIQASRERNGSSSDTRKYAITRLNTLASAQAGTAGLISTLVVLLEVSGVRPAEVESFLAYCQDQEQLASNGRDFEDAVIAHARGMVLAIQMLREGPDPDAPSPLRPKSRT